MTEEILLSVAIPTYNRSDFLDISLHSLVKSALKTDSKVIEIIVLDNASTDGTANVMKKYGDYEFIKYIKNDENIGPDRNFKKAISQSIGKYVWLFGDDDLVFEHTLEYLLRLLSSCEECGIVHLKAKNFTNNPPLEEMSPRMNFKIYDKKEEFVKAAHTNLTFITSNIINKTVFEKINIDEICDNNLGQFYWNLVCVMLSQKQIVVFDKIYAARQFNSGNYNFSEVFGKNLNETINAVANRYNANFIKEIFAKRLLIYYYPANIIRIRCALSAVKNENCFWNLYALYKNRIYFWMFTVTAMWIPKRIGLLIVKFMQTKT